MAIRWRHAVWRNDWFMYLGNGISPVIELWWFERRIYMESRSGTFSARRWGFWMRPLELWNVSPRVLADGILLYPGMLGCAVLIGAIVKSRWYSNFMGLSLTRFCQHSMLYEGEEHVQSTEWCMLHLRAWRGDVRECWFWSGEQSLFSMIGSRMPDLRFLVLPGCSAINDNVMYY